MSAVWDANIFKQNQQTKVAHVPVWIFQGGNDPRPTPAYTQTLINNLKKGGSVVRYSYYATLGHVVWTKAYSEADYFSWMLRQNKSYIHPFAGNTVIDKAKNIYPKLMLAEGFLAYQWEKDGVILSTKSNTLTATAPGTYRARFSRKATYPTEAQWNKWSPPVKVTQATTSTTLAATGAPTDAQQLEAAPEQVSMEEALSFNVYPNPASADNIRLELQGMAESPVQVKIVDQMGRELYAQTFETPGLASGQQLALPSSAQGGVYILMVNQGQRQLRKKVVVK
jgi:hypothetical protein